MLSEMQPLLCNRMTTSADFIQTVHDLSPEMGKSVRSLQRLEALSERIDQLSDTIAEADAVADRLRRLEAELTALRTQKDVRDRLFGMARAELIKYRDAFEREVLQK